MQDVPESILQDLAKRAMYVGSPEHKDVPSFLGQPRLRGDASICDRELARDLPRVQSWLHEAFLSGCIGCPWEGGFPRYVWHQAGETVYEGRLVNKELGQYKGYPLDGDEWPTGWESVE